MRSFADIGDINVGSGEVWLEARFMVCAIVFLAVVFVYCERDRNIRNHTIYEVSVDGDTYHSLGRPRQVGGSLGSNPTWTFYDYNSRSRVYIPTAIPFTYRRTGRIVK